MKWKDEYSTGVPELDAQHKALFRFSEDFRDVLENGFGAESYDLFLEFLSAYSDTHFDYEDRCMLAHLCPVAGRNRHEHRAFRQLIAMEEAEYTEKGFDHRRAMDLLAGIDRWLASHIGRIDVQLKDYVV